MLVSAIMPTAGRPQMAAEAVAMWRAQTWPEKELVIVDNRYSPSFRRSVVGPGIVYQSETSMSIGAKRNLACGLASGEIICHWDSDDIYAPDRIEDQVKRLTETGAEVTGYCPMLFVDERGQRWQYFTPDTSYAPGTSLMYRKSYWRRHPFGAQMKTGEDLKFIQGARVVAVDGGERCIARIHSGSLTWLVDTPKTEAHLLSEAGRRNWRRAQ